MQTIVVKGSSQLQNIISQLTNLNSQYQAKVNELCNTEKTLDKMWDGEANEAFKQNFNKDKKQFDEFYNAIKEYIEKLKTIKENYGNAEAHNKQIVSN